MYVVSLVLYHLLLLAPVSTVPVPVRNTTEGTRVHVHMYVCTDPFIHHCSTNQQSPEIIIFGCAKYDQCSIASMSARSCCLIVESI